MRDYFTINGSFVNYEWPLTKAKNASGPAASDGTPFTVEFIDDLWGPIKAIMCAAGLTPDGVSEDYNSSQVLTALRRILGNPGEFVFCALNATELAKCRLMWLTGQYITIATYPELFEAVYCGAGENESSTFFARYSDMAGTKSTTGAYLRLPDCRGLFPRGIGTNALMYPDVGHSYTGPTLYQGPIQDSLQDFSIPLGTDGTSSGSAGYGASTIGAYIEPAKGVSFPYSPRLSYETKPVSGGARWCIRY